MIITLQSGNTLSSGEFTINRPPAPFVSLSHELNTYIQIDNEGNTHMLDMQSNHHITIPKSTWEMDDTQPQNETEIVETSISQDILEIFCESQSAYTEETHEEFLKNLTTKQYIFPIIK